MTAMVTVRAIAATHTAIALADFSCGMAKKTLIASSFSFLDANSSCLCEQLFSSRSYLVCRFYVSADSHLTYDLTCAFGGQGVPP